MTRTRRHDLPARAREASHAVLARPRHVALAALVAGLLAAGAPRWIAAALATGAVVAGALTRRGAPGVGAGPAGPPRGGGARGRVWGGGRPPPPAPAPGGPGGG